MIDAASQVRLLGVGTTYYVALLGQYLFASLADLDAPAMNSDASSPSTNCRPSPSRP